MQKAFLLLAFIVIISNCTAQPLAIQWQKCFGGTMQDFGCSIRQTSEGGYLACGFGNSNDGDFSGNHSVNGYDCWVVKLDNTGNVLWQRCYGGSTDEFFYSIKLIEDGSFITAGLTVSIDGDLTGVYQPGGDGSWWIVNCDSIGTINWQKCLGGSGEEEAVQIISTLDHGFIGIGWTYSSDFDALGRHDSTICPFCTDAMIAKLDSVGTIEWSKCFGGFSQEEGNSIIQTSDSGFVFASLARSDNGQVQGLHGATMGDGYSDYWIVKIDAAGVIEWQKCFGGSDAETPSDISQTLDGGFIVIGDAISNDYDVSGNHSNQDAWVLKLDSVGNMQWQKCLGGSGYERGLKIIQLTDGGFLTLNSTNSIDGDLTSNPANQVDVWIVKLDPFGNIIWQQCFGGSGFEEAYDMQITSDGGVIFTGSTYSNDGDVSGNHGYSDVWVVKLAPLPDGISTYANAITDFTVYQSNISHTIGLSFYCNGNENVSVQLLDLTGRVLLQQPLSVSSGFNKKQVQTGNISTGVYLVRLATDAGAVVKKLMVQ